MPPSLVLEVLRITEIEMDLRDLTRETEQARRGMPRADWRADVEDLEIEQDELVWRTADVIEAVRALPNGEQEFERELARLSDARAAMEDALQHLASPTTGPVAVAAETEAIEHLLRARRSNGGGGGGGSSPGRSNAQGSTDVTALALVGRSEDPDAVVEEREVVATTGRSGEDPPEELRGSLDRYFERLNAK